MNREDANVWEKRRGGYEYDSVPMSTASAGSVDIDFKRMLSIWPFILLFGLIGYAVGNIFLRYTNETYIASTSLSLDDKEEISLTKVLFGDINQSFNDKIEFLKSPSLAYRVVDSLQLQYSAKAQGRFKDKNFYGILKWRILNISDPEDPEIDFTIFPKKNGFRYVAGSIEGNAVWSVPFFIGKNQVQIDKLMEIGGEAPVFCESRKRQDVANELSSRIEIQKSNSSQIITIRYSDISNDKAIDVLNGTVRLYNISIEQVKSKGYTQAVNFIEQRMEPLRKELDSIESSLAAFKSSRGMSSSSDLYLQKMQSYDNELTRISIMESTIKAVEDFMKNPNIKDADIAFVGIDNPGLQSVLSQYQQLRQQRDKLMLTAQETNPSIMLIDRNLSDLKSNMENQLQSYRNNLRIAQNTYQSKIGSASSALKSIPIAEKELMDKTRFQNIKEQLYLTLLQKREEAAIAKASITVNTTIYNPATKSNTKISPPREIVLSVAVLIGFLIPLIFALIKELMNNKLVSKKQIQKITDVPVISELEQVQNSDTSAFAIEGSQRSMFGEQIRSLRTNLNFYIDANKKTNYILLTSSVSGEGKSFLSLNLAKSYSLQGKKVALLEFDLRRPKISKALGFNDIKTGLSGMLLGKENPSDIIVSVVNTENEKLDLFPAGAIPPNPQELIAGEKMKSLKEYLDSNYDIVVVDTPPFGIVADAQILGQWADVSLILTRFNQTLKEQVVEINEWKKRGVFQSMALVFNGIKNSGYFGYKYGYYYYKRKYGYNYYSGYTSTGKSEKK